MKKLLFSISMAAMSFMVAAKEPTTEKKIEGHAVVKVQLSSIEYLIAIQSSFTGLFNSRYQGYFDESPEKMDELKQALKDIIREDQAALKKYILPSMQPYAGGLILRQLTFIIQDPDTDGLISYEDADVIIDERLVGKMGSPWADGNWASGRYMVTDKGLVESTWIPNRASELVLYLDGNMNKPVLSGYCGNPAIRQKKTVVPQKEDTKYSYVKTESKPKRGLGGIVTTNTATATATNTTNVNIYGTGGRSNNSEPVAVKKKGNGVVPAVLGFVGGVVTGALLNNGRNINSRGVVVRRNDWGHGTGDGGNTPRVRNHTSANGQLPTH